MKNTNSEVIIALCSHLVKTENVKPYEPLEWSKLAERLLNENLYPKDILNFTDTDFYNINLNDYEIQRIKKLLDRSGSIAFEIEKYESMGINIVTRADNSYPKALKNKLKKNCPPLFYYAGNLKLAEENAVGFVGSRNVNIDDHKFTESIVNKVNQLGYIVVSGGARGIDEISTTISINNGSASISYIADSLIKKIRIKSNIDAIQNGKLLLLTAVKPDMGFTVGTAMARNSYIYGQSVGTVVIRSDYKKGGTWNGATECLKNKLCPVYCWNNNNYKGNKELINLGAVPIDENWNGNIDNTDNQTEEVIQLSLFD